MNQQLKARTTAERVLWGSRQYDVPDMYLIEEYRGREYYDDHDQWCCRFPDGSSLRLQDNVGLVLFRV